MHVFFEELRVLGSVGIMTGPAIYLRPFYIQVSLLERRFGKAMALSA